MTTRLCTIKLSIRDYDTKEEGKVVYNGEVVSIDEELRHYMFRFYNTESGTLLVTVDASKEVIKVIEKSENINLSMGIKIDTYEECIYDIDSSRLELETRTFDVQFENNVILFDYDLYAKNDIEHRKPLTRNVVRIEYEGDKKVC